jgi:MFS family permease
VGWRSAYGTSAPSFGHIVSFTLGGYILEHVSWRPIFFLGIPTGIVAAVLGLLILP